jgi:hypothetical protein
MEVVLCSKVLNSGLAEVWESAMPKFKARLEKEPLLGIKKQIETAKEQDWYCCSLSQVMDKFPEDDFPFSEEYDVIFYASTKIDAITYTIDNEAYEIISCQEVTSVKRKARNLNLKGFKPINGRGEWTYLDVSEIIEGFRSFDFIAFKKEVAKEITAIKTTSNIFKSDFRNNLAKKFRVGVCLNRLKHSQIKAKCSQEELKELIIDTFAENPKHKIDDDCVIITAADSNIFTGLQLLLISITLSHEADVIVYDLGLTEEQIDWVKSTGASIVCVNHDELIIPDTASCWQTWNKPIYIQNTNKRYVFWIDADACVLRNLRPAFEIIKEKGLLLVADNVAKVYTKDPMDCIVNLRSLYEKLPTPSHIIKNHPNAGIIGVDRNSEIAKSLLTTWLFCIEQASLNERIKISCKWHDQGALLWALEKLCLAELIIEDPYWNDGQSWNSFGRKFISRISDLLEHIQVINSGIIHFAGMYKPWRDDD